MSKIEWTNETWNPIIGCSKISAGCQNCYAEKMAHRLFLNPKAPIAYAQVVYNGNWNGRTGFIHSALDKPLQWKKPRKIFVCSMGDLFHESVNFHAIIEVFEIISRCPQHTFQILTKRPERMKEFFEFASNPFANLPNVWLGVTTENQEMANKRIPILMEIPAAKKFISVEPMLEQIDIRHWFVRLHWMHNVDPLDWVICGGETGLNARLIQAEWVKSLRDQCLKHDVPFFFKSWGGKPKKQGSAIDGIEYKQFPKL